MALKASATPLIITLTQGSADAFVQGSVLSGLSGNQAYNLLGVAWEMTSSACNVTAAEYQVSLSRRSKTSQPVLSDTDVIWNLRWQQILVTSGFPITSKSGYWKPEVQIPIVEETIYAQLDSAATAVVNTFILRLDVELDTMQPIDRLNLITRSLT
jgi:hypothetical protein